MVVRWLATAAALLFSQRGFSRLALLVPLVLGNMRVLVYSYSSIERKQSRSFMLDTAVLDTAAGYVENTDSSEMPSVNITAVLLSAARVS